MHPELLLKTIGSFGNFDLVPIGFVQGTNQPVVAPFQQTIVKAPRSFTEQFDSNKGQNFGLSLSIHLNDNSKCA